MITRTGSAHRAAGYVWVFLLDLLGRLMIALLFLWSGVFGIVLGWPSAPDMIARRGLPAPTLLGLAAGAVELLAPIALFIPRLEVWAALVLAGYCIATAVLFHDYWMLEEPARLQQMFHFMKNIALAGALLVIVARSDARSRVGRVEGI
ncbi:MAG: DoxX family protein [Microvirga sp.]|jgi:putative oxidoreductase